MNLSAKSLADRLLKETGRIGHDLRSVALLIGPEAFEALRLALFSHHGRSVEDPVWETGIDGAKVQITGGPRFYRLIAFPFHSPGWIIAEGCFDKPPAPAAFPPHGTGWRLTEGEVM